MHLVLRLAFAVLLVTLSACSKILGDFNLGASDGGGSGGGNGGPDGSVPQGPIVVDPPNGLMTTEMGGKATFTILRCTQETKSPSR
jgi:hypothetical protein